MSLPVTITVTSYDVPADHLESALRQEYGPGMTLAEMLAASRKRYNALMDFLEAGLGKLEDDMPGTAQPPRKERRKAHLDASVVPVEQALLARAHELSSRAMRELAVLGPEAEGPVDPARIEPNLRLIMAEAFRELAEELHWR